LTNETIIGDDEKSAFELKKESMSNYSTYYNILKNTNCYNYSRNLHNCYQQLMHVSQIKSSKNGFYFFNAGMSNCVIIVALSFSKMNQDKNYPFMTILKTKTPDLYSPFFGKIRKIKIPNSEYTYIISNWRRLPLSKITYMRDSFYSVLSSTMNSILSSPLPSSYFYLNKMEYIFSLRTIVAYSTNQKISELLMDTRYAYMSAFSLYTNINKLLVEKFKPPYSTCLETWIVNRLLKQLPIIHENVLKEGILQTRIEMSLNVRDVNTIGGRIKLPGLWGDYIMNDITELLDEAFMYVHTMKEPSNIFHENVKALKIINAFQKEYDNLPLKHKNGCFNNAKDWENYLSLNTKIGCSATVIYHSTKHTLEKEKPFFKKK